MSLQILFEVGVLNWGRRYIRMATIMTMTITMKKKYLMGSLSKSFTWQVKWVWDHAQKLLLIFPNLIDDLLEGFKWFSNKSTCSSYHEHHISPVSLFLQADIWHGCRWKPVYKEQMIYHAISHVLDITIAKIPLFEIPTSPLGNWKALFSAHLHLAGPFSISLPDENSTRNITLTKSVALWVPPYKI